MGRRQIQKKRGYTHWGYSLARYFKRCYLVLTLDEAYHTLSGAC